jgi:hypothetical protein
VYAGDSCGNLHVLDADLKLLSTRPITPKTQDWVRLHLHAAADLDGDGRQELVLESAEVEFVSGSNPGYPEGKANHRLYHRHHLLVYDCSLHEIADHEIVRRTKNPAFGPVLVLPANADGTRDLALLAQKVIVLHLNRQPKPRSMAMSDAPGS